MAQEYIHPHLMRTLAVRDDVTYVGGSGAELIASSGEKHIDFFTDVGTASLGYNSPEYRNTLSRLLNENIPAHAPNLYLFDERNRAAERLCKITGKGKVFFCNSGTESVEGAIKLARKWQHDKGSKRRDIWSYAGGFHGRTGFAMTAGNGPQYHYAGFGPFPAGFWHFQEMDEIDWNTAAAVIMAPVFGNNDVQLYSRNWLEELSKRCQANGTLLIFDEVQTGSGRTGRPTYAQKCGVKADIITMAKGIAMGVPVGAVLANDDVARAFTPGTHFSTFGGNPLCCAFVNGMLDWLEDEKNLARVEEVGNTIKRLLGDMGWPKNVRGEGMLIAFDLELDGLLYAQQCFRYGLLIGAFRPGPGPVKVTPPLNITDEEMERGMVILDRAYMALAMQSKR